MSIVAGAPAPAAGPVPPPARVARGSAAPAVLLGGLVTTLLALAGVWLVATRAEENVMGWYADYVLPVGALLVGGVASTGFGLASWLTGTRITGRLLVAVGLCLVAGYWAAQLLEFRLAFPDGASFDDGTPAGFLDWYDAVTRSFAWKDHDKLGAALGAWGYLLRAGELVGFAAGGLLAPIVLRGVPYCAACGVYMRQPLVAVVPAGVKPRRVGKKDAAGQASYQAEVAEAAPRAGRRAAHRLTARLQVRVVHCRRCAAGELRVALATGQGQQLKVTPVRTEALERGVAPRLAAKA